MTLKGYIFMPDFSDMRNLTKLLSNMTNNLNQIAKRINAGGNVCETELYEIMENQQKLWHELRSILLKLDGLYRKET